MHIKRMHEMIECLTEYGKCMIEAGTGDGKVNLCDAGQVVDMIKDLADAEYHARIAKAMEKEEEDEKEEEKHMIRMLKEEYGMGEEDGKRFYDAWRYKSSGRFAPRGKGERYGRRGYEEPPYMHIPEDYKMDLADYKGKTAEEMRDLDRKAGRLYFSTPMSDIPKHDIMRDAREGRSGEKRRGYMETKEMHKDNSPESKQRRMKDLETYAKELTEDIVEMVGDATPEEHALMKQKLQVLLQKL